MKKKVIFLACLVTSCVFAKENQDNNPLNQMGHYQITATEKELFLLETNTGKIWVAKKCNRPDPREAITRWYLVKTEIPKD
jgi:hypothetical protein